MWYFRLTRQRAARGARGAAQVRSGKQETGPWKLCSSAASAQRRQRGFVTSRLVVIISQLGIASPEYCPCDTRHGKCLGCVVLCDARRAVLHSSRCTISLAGHRDPVSSPCPRAFNATTGAFGPHFRSHSRDSGRSLRLESVCVEPRVNGAA